MKCEKCGQEYPNKKGRFCGACCRYRRTASCVLALPRETVRAVRARATNANGYGYRNWLRFLELSQLAVAMTVGAILLAFGYYIGRPLLPLLIVFGVTSCFGLACIIWVIWRYSRHE